MELEGYELVNRAIQLAIELRREINNHPLISKYFRAATPAEMIPGEYRQTRYAITERLVPRSQTRSRRWTKTSSSSIRRASRCSVAGRGSTASQFKALLASDYDIQINKTSRNSVLVQININNTRSDLAHLVKVLADISRGIERRLAEGGDAERQALSARVKNARRGRAGPAGLQLVP